MDQAFPAEINGYTVISMIRIPTGTIEIANVWLGLFQDGTGEHGEIDNFIIWEVRRDDHGRYSFRNGSYDYSDLRTVTLDFVRRAAKEVR